MLAPASRGTMLFTHKYSGQIAGTKTSVCDKAVFLGSVQYLNTTAAVAYIQLFNLPVADVTLGTTAPTLSYGIAASASGNIPLGDGLKLGGSALTIGCTTTRTGSTGAAVDLNVVFD